MTTDRYELTAIALFSEQTTIQLTCGECPADVAVAAQWPKEDGVPFVAVQQAIEKHDHLHTVIDKSGTLHEASIVVADGRTVLRVTTYIRSGTPSHPRWQETVTTSGVVLTEDAEGEVAEDHIVDVLTGMGFVVAGPWQSAGLRYAAMLMPAGTPDAPTKVACNHGSVLGQDSCSGCDAAEDQPHSADMVSVVPVWSTTPRKMCRECGQRSMAWAHTVKP